jgi:hypothetical protein
VCIAASALTRAARSRPLLTALRSPRQATFSFVLLDAGARCLLAARSGADAPPLAWGSAADGALLFASDADALRGLCDRPAGGAAPFPAGCFYRAADDDTPPQLVGCVRVRGRQARCCGHACTS